MYIIYIILNKMCVYITIIKNTGKQFYNDIVNNDFLDEFRSIFALNKQNKTRLQLN